MLHRMKMNIKKLKREKLHLHTMKNIWFIIRECVNRESWERLKRDILFDLFTYLAGSSFFLNKSNQSI